MASRTVHDGRRQLKHFSDTKKWRTLGTSCSYTLNNFRLDCQPRKINHCLIQRTENRARKINVFDEVGWGGVRWGERGGVEWGGVGQK